MKIKYRIIRSYKSGYELYFPQYKKLFFWAYFTKIGMSFHCFPSLSQAEEFIKTEKQLQETIY